MSNGRRRVLPSIWTIVVALLAGLPLLTATVAGDAPAPSIDGKYLLAFNDYDCGLLGAVSEDATCSSPKFARTHLLQSDDGVTWRPVPGFRAFPGGVPDVVRRGDTLYIYANMLNPRERIGLRVRKYHFDTDVWDEPVYVALSEGQPPYSSAYPEQEIPVEVSAVVDDQGRIVIFYCVLRYMNDDTNFIRSATEVEGSDGTEFVVDEGDRFALPSAGTVEVCNPEVFRAPGTYIMYAGFAVRADIGYGERGILALGSTTLRGDYAPLEGLGDGVLATAVAAHPGGHYDPTTKEYWTYTVPARPIPKDVILRATHETVDRPLSASQFQTVAELDQVPGSDETFIDGADGGLQHPRLGVNEPYPGDLVEEDEGTDGRASANDRDGDGVPDDQDLCPDWPGSEEMSGC